MRAREWGDMLHHVNAFREKFNDHFYAIFRVIIGVLFMFHGLQKVFGIYASNGAQQLFTFMWWVGIVEFLGGLFVALGLFTAVAATASAVIMVGAFFTAHFTLANPVPIANRGELALVYLAAFLFIVFEGGGRYSLDTLCRKCCGGKAGCCEDGGDACCEDAGDSCCKGAGDACCKETAPAAAVAAVKKGKAAKKKR